MRASILEQLEAAKAALEQSDRRWNSALESAETGVWDCDLPNDAVSYSRMWKRMRGFDADEVVSGAADEWLKRVHPDDRARVQEIIGKQNTGELKANALEYRERHKAGHYIWISSLGAPVEWAIDGTPTRVIGTDIDITTRKVAEQERLELSRRLELALSVSKVGVFEANLLTGELIWDNRIYETYGIVRSQNALHGSDWEGALHPEDAAATLAAMDRAIRAKGTFDVTYRIVRPGGEIRTVVSRGTYFQDHNTTPRFIGADWDISVEVALTQSVQHARELAEARNIELDAARARMEHQSLHDALTGLPNRRHLDAVLAQYFGGHLQGKDGLALLQIDLDGFKAVNDTIGHNAGDEVLVQVAQRLKAGAPGNTFIARLGGDEFVVCLRGDICEDSALGIAESLNDAISKPFVISGQTVHIGSSTGIALAPMHGATAANLMVAADLALYRAKTAGRNASRVFVPAYRIQMQQQQSIESELRCAFDEHQFELRPRRAIPVCGLLAQSHGCRG